MSNITGWLISTIFVVLIIIILILYLRGFFRPRTPYSIDNLPLPKATNFASTVAGLSDSFIFDPRSFFHNDELNLIVTENKLIKNIEKFF